MQYTALTALLLAFVTVCSGDDYRCRDQSASCCTSGMSWCTPDKFMVNDADGNAVCRCDSACKMADDLSDEDTSDESEEKPCCEDKISWCGMLKRMMLENENEIQRQYMDAAKRELIAEEKELANVDNREVERERDELITLLAKLLKEHP